ncbi:MAG: ABC transporter ATP-binding protein/permease [Faecalimonas sp.]|nr:ABC transporter ATP-binding protein/permease [Faecalimonas sp.]
MLQIQNICKQYRTGDLVQNALKDVSLNLRDSEFVSILGPSGSGKTTLLNIIGGLDRYDSGDLIINNVSTKRYKDRDWDSYRNHTIGFVFQSYNLIPHQSVLANVELALTIGGISKKERKRRALDALEQVGLRDQAHKKPNQMSGGQMQRVAIARALVNNPDILLADEPTGALDSETSVQVMELLKEVAHDRLVIMVTHNPELAETYSTRIIKLHDGRITDDSDPFVPETQELVAPEHKNLGKASMSIFTALNLSMNNLLTKKARTLLTAFAGSIGIIGIALILSLSTGFQNYIDKIQEDTLTSYPLTVMADTADPTTALLSMVSEKGEGTGKDEVKEQQYMETMFASIGKNDLKALKRYLEKNADEVDEMVSLLQYQYMVSPMIYTTDVTGKIAQLNPSTMLASLSGAGSSTMMSSMTTSVFYEMMDDKAGLETQYDVLRGRWPDSYDEVVLVLPEPNAISDLLLYGLGLRDSAELQKSISKLMEGEVIEHTSEPLKLTYEELMNIPLKLVDATDTYRYNEQYQVYESMTADQEFMKQVYADAIELKIVGIVCPEEGTSSMNMMTGVAYTKALTEHVIAEAEKSEIVQTQLGDEEVDVFSNKRFDDDSEESGLNFDDMISVNTELLSSAFGMDINQNDIAQMTEGYMGEISSAITTDTATAQKALQDNLKLFMTEMLTEFVKANQNPLMGNLAVLKLSDVEAMVNAYMAKESTQTALGQLEASYVIPKDVFVTTYQELLKGLVQGYVTNFSAGQDSPGAEPDAEPTAFLTMESIEPLVTALTATEPVGASMQMLAAKMTEAVMQKTILSKVGELTQRLMGTVASSFDVDESKIAAAFQFNMNEEELMRLMQTMSTKSVEKNARTNLLSLGYQDLNDPTSISFYFASFEAKEAFMEFLDAYNERMEEIDEEKVIQYTDLTGILMSSVQVIVNSVSYVLIAFVSISLIVSSIMIGIITYISVLERTKEIGVLRAIGASKKNISSIFNAETFIVGLCSGLLGILVTLVLLQPINYIIHTLTGNPDITAVLPVQGGVILVILSVVLTLISGLIPSKKAAKKDPVSALRSE